MKRISCNNLANNCHKKSYPLVLWLALIIFVSSPFQVVAFNNNTSYTNKIPTLTATVVSGQIIDENGNVLSGVSIIEKGTSNGVLSEEDGTFKISVKNGNAILMISSSGYLSQEVKVGNNKNFTIVLKQSVSKLDEVVVVGYGTQKKATLTGAVASITSDDIITTKNEGLLNTLSGKLPGVIVAQNTSEPGSYDNAFNIRGLGNPLIVIDGIAQENQSAFLRLNPIDIESISVLKDASAAVYGFRSANGVVLVTTKQGKAGKFSFAYSGLYGFQKRSGVPSVLGPVDFMQLANEFVQRGGYTSGLARTYTQEQMDEYIHGTKQGTDWIGLTMAENVPQTQHTISATGGSDKIKFYSNCPPN